MGQVARSLREPHGDVEATLQAITHGAAHDIRGADGCGITLVIQQRKVQSRAATGELPYAVDTLQERVGEGPCLEALYQHHTVRIDDISQERRWPQFAAEAARLGVGSMLSFRLFVREDTLGALNLYSGQAHAFGSDSESVGEVFAAHAAVALSGAQTEAHLRAALSSRDLIGQAKGILMERYRVTADQAFAMLVRASSRTNRKVTDLADELCSTGHLGGPDSS